MAQKDSNRPNRKILHIFGLLFTLILLLAAPFFHIVSSPKGYLLVTRDHPGIGPLFLDSKKVLRHPDLVPVKVRENL
ncbi:MAG: hypothetical protein H3C47_02025 [Candidatus Cloacimonetes bacterium]|nr:hypothetical protein [Candidatus Cloacimonadota bacterium]